jgi:hypothetical protein
MPYCISPRQTVNSYRRPRLIFPGYVRQFAEVRRSDLPEENVVAVFILALGMEERRAVTIIVSDGLPTQKGIGLPINDIPDIRCVACVRISNCDYVPVCI